MEQVADPGELAEQPEVEGIVAEGLGGDVADPAGIARPGADERLAKFDVTCLHYPSSSYAATLARGAVAV